MAYPKNSFPYQNLIGSNGSVDIIKFIKSRKNVIHVLNIEKNEKYQKLGTDLMVSKYLEGRFDTKYIEIKTDKHHNTGNYFLEVIGNDYKGTPGGMIYTKADYVFYYFINIKQLHVIDRVSLQKWIINNGQALKYVDVPTVDNYNNFLYNTVGALVSRELLKRTIPIWIYDLNINECIFKPDAKLLASFIFLKILKRIFIIL